MAIPPFDDEAATFVDAVYQRADAFLFGRHTYEIFAGSWGAFEDPGCAVAKRLRSERRPFRV
jgi:dihydrofolate reductase